MVVSKCINYFKPGFLNLCAQYLVFREKNKKIKNILAQIKEIKKYL
jgi:hypothetical protein